MASSQTLRYTFDISAPRENTNAEKYTLREKLFGTDNVLPVWVADMDIDTPDFVLEAVKKRLLHPIIGYEDVPASAYEAQIRWMKKEHGVDFSLEEMLHSHSVVASMSVAIEAFSKAGEKVIVQTPVYPPFFQSVHAHQRKILKNPLKQSACGKYVFDIEDLKSKIDQSTKLLLLCSPHNPVGRVWSRDELEEILEVCLEHNIVVFSDEIHSDLVYEPNKHIPFASLSQKARNITVTAMGVGKTFNMAGFAMSSVAIPNKALRDRFLEVYKRVHFAQGNVLSHVAFEAAYTDGKEWLAALKIHLMQNFRMLEKLCAKFPHAIQVTQPQATYLAWLDCRRMGLSNKELKGFFVTEAKLGLNMGLSFAKEGSGFMRLNFAISSAKMLEVVEHLEFALQKRFEGSKAC
ncbi:pyridoxal phosphate-dependent aminotransferase [bacterium]|nr:pyridoxal phosphate-dependent aminotransferase [bacterium]MBU1994235.1 pyridoxal phosphate-dependent aminotransferase [bacterium]